MSSSSSPQQLRNSEHLCLYPVHPPRRTTADPSWRTQSWGLLLYKSYHTLKHSSTCTYEPHTNTCCCILFHQQTVMCINQRYPVKLRSCFVLVFTHIQTLAHTEAAERAEPEGRMGGCRGDTDLITFFLFSPLLNTSCCIILNTFFLLKLKMQKLLMCTASFCT